MELNLTYYFLLFMIYSIAGWILEVTCKYIDYKRFINRGFLIGPYCPIYGYGAILITFLLYRYESDPIVLLFVELWNMLRVGLWKNFLKPDGGITVNESLI